MIKALPHPQEGTSAPSRRHFRTLIQAYRDPQSGTFAEPSMAFGVAKRATLGCEPSYPRVRTKLPCDAIHAILKPPSNQFGAFKLPVWSLQTTFPCATTPDHLY